MGPACLVPGLWGRWPGEAHQDEGTAEPAGRTGLEAAQDTLGGVGAPFLFHSAVSISIPTIFLQGRTLYSSIQQS